MKKFFSAILLMAAMAFSVSTFVSCNDLTNEMEDVKAQATQNAAAIDALETQITALQSALATAQATADAAKKAGEDAAAAAAQAKADAIKEAKAECEIVKAALEAKIAEVNTALAGKASKEELQAAIDQATAGLNDLAATLGAKIEGIEAGLNKMATIAQLNEEVAKLLAADQELALQIAALKAYSDTTYATVEEAEAIREELTNLANENYNELQKLIGGNASAIAATIDTVEVIAAALEGYMESNDSRINEIAKAVAAAGDDIAAIEEAIKGYVDNHNADITRVSEQIALAFEDIDALSELVKTNNENLNAYYKALAASVEDLGTELRAEIAALKAGLEALTPRVEDLEADVTALDADLSTLKTLVKNLLRSITFAPKTIIGGVEAIEFANFEYKPMDKVDDKFNADPKGYNTSVSEAAYAYYHFNPSSFDLAKATYTYKDRAVDVKSGSNLVTIEAGPKAMDDKTVEFKLRRDNTTKATKDNMIALEATITADGNVVRSPYVQVVDSYDYQADLYVADAKTLRHYYLTAKEAADSQEAMYKMVWDGSLDFEPLAVACLHDGENHHAWDVEEKYGFTFRYSVAPVDYFAGEVEGETWTEQQRVLNAPVANENGVNALFTAKPNKESIGRTPIVLVEILDQNGKIVRYGYAKVEIVVLPEEDVERELAIAKTITYDCTASEYIGNVAIEKATIQTPFDETWFQNNLYKTLTDGYNTVGMSHSEFWNMYYWDEAATTVTKNGKAWGMSTPYIAEGSTMNGTQTKIVAWKFDHSEFGPIGEGASFVGTVVLKNKVVNSEYPEKITLSIAFDVVLPEVSFKATKDNQYWNANNEFVVNPTIPDSPEATSEFFYYDQNIYEAYVGQKVEVVTTAKTACYTHGYELVKVYADPAKPFADKGGVQFDGKKIYFDELTPAAEAALNAGTLKAHFQYVVEFVQGKMVLDRVVINDMYATIVKPVYMNLNIDPQLELTDALDNGDQVEINYEGLFTDWRGFAITKGEEVYVPFTYYEWVLDCPANHGHYVYTEAPAVATTTTTVTVPADVPTYTASVTARLVADWKGFNGENDNRYPFPTTITKTFTGTAQLTKADAINSLKDVLNKANVEVGTNGYEGVSVEDYALEWAYDLEAATFAEGTTTKETEITIVTKTVYTAAKYEYVVDTHETEAPEYDGEYAGQKNGCWIWTEKQYNKPEIQGLQYWNFYGMADCFDLVLDKVTTNLDYNGGKLPEAAKLEQVGTTLKYHNVHSPVHYDYEIYVPVTMAYKFGTLEGKLTIKVKSILPQE